MYAPTFWDWATLLGSIGLFFALLFLFLRLLPAISMSEMRELVPESHEMGDTMPHGSKPSH
jgi:molybdopterin-containing oxidoreductase family membrane subunit